MKTTRLSLSTQGDGLTDITSLVKDLLQREFLNKGGPTSGLLHLFLQHTSCALTINEAYDPLAAKDLESFLKHIAPENLNFIQHKDEGPDDSPSHMKALITGHSLSIPIVDGVMQLGRWQGIYLCEFRASPKKRAVLLSYLS